jgi:hypothetical protein
MGLQQPLLLAPLSLLAHAEHWKSTFQFDGSGGLMHDGHALGVIGIADQGKMYNSQGSSNWIERQGRGSHTKNTKNTFDKFHELSRVPRHNLWIFLRNAIKTCNKN